MKIILVWKDHPGDQRQTEITGRPDAHITCFSVAVGRWRIRRKLRHPSGKLKLTWLFRGPAVSMLLYPERKRSGMDAPRPGDTSSANQFRLHVRNGKWATRADFVPFGRRSHPLIVYISVRTARCYTSLWVLYINKKRQTASWPYIYPCTSCVSLSSRLIENCLDGHPWFNESSRE